jgi:hypothetical protein
MLVFLLGALDSTIVGTAMPGVQEQPIVRGAPLGYLRKAKPWNS